MIYLPEQDIIEIQRVLSSFPNLKQALVFGSRVKGTHHQGSDVDIALELNPYSHDDVLRIHQALEEETALPYFFDVVDLNHIENPDLISHIKRLGEAIYPG